ncbi:TPA: hypothetical protein ACRMZW_004332 [Pseudomonas aeruginosa]
MVTLKNVSSDQACSELRNAAEALDAAACESIIREFGATPAAIRRALLEVAFSQPGLGKPPGFSQRWKEGGHDLRVAKVLLDFGIDRSVVDSELLDALANIVFDAVQEGRLDVVEAVRANGFEISAHKRSETGPLVENFNEADVFGVRLRVAAKPVAAPMEEMKVTKLEKSFAIKVPYELKGCFRNALPSAKWNPKGKYWEVGPRSKDKLDAWLEKIEANAEWVKAMRGQVK